MAFQSKKLTALLIVACCLAVVGGVRVIKGNSTSTFRSNEEAKVKGEKNAPLMITEFIDFQCPACAKGAAYLSDMLVKHPGLIRLQLKHFPLQMHRHGLLSARYAECSARQGKFWGYHDLLLARQGNWSRLDDASPAFDQMADEVELDKQALASCLQGADVQRLIDKNMTEGQSLGIRSTPTYFVNGKMVVGMQSLEMEINKYLNENSR